MDYKSDKLTGNSGCRIHSYSNAFCQSTRIATACLETWGLIRVITYRVGSRTSMERRIKLIYFVTLGPYNKMCLILLQNIVFTGERNNGDLLASWEKQSNFRLGSSTVMIQTIINSHFNCISIDTI